MTINELINSIMPLDKDAMQLAEKRQISLAKPPQSLGRLEELSIQLSGVTGRLCQYLSKEVQNVTRIFCGLEQKLK